jgi:nucleoside-triphosphatase THEP1
VIFVLTGPVHSGKTTLLEKAVHEFRKHKFKIDGFLSKALWEGQEVIGYDLFDLREGNSIPLLRRTGERDWQRAGSYFFIPSGLEEAERIILRSRNADLFVVDEIGPLELSGKGFWPALKQALFPPQTAYLIVVRDKILEDLLGVLGRSQTKVFDVRDEVTLSRLTEEIREAVQSK